MTTLREAIEQTVAILGPEAPLCSGCVAEWTEALRILRAALAEQPAEPVAWMGVPVMPGRYKEAVFCSDKALAMQWDYSGHLGLGRLIVTPLYTAPQPAKRVPLTREHVRTSGGIVHSDGNVFFTSLDQLNSAIEAAHGITGETE